jgi:hypothetical protein
VPPISVPIVMFTGFPTVFASVFFSAVSIVFAIAPPVEFNVVFSCICLVFCCCLIC